MREIIGRKDVNAPFRQPESIKAMDMHTGEVTEAKRDMNTLTKAYEREKIGIKRISSKFILDLETCEDGIKEEKVFYSLDELQKYLDTECNPYTYSIISIKEIAEYEREY